MPFTTATGPVDDQGSVIYFVDTGPVPGSGEYTTLVILHGSVVTGKSFHKLLSLCEQDNIRLVIVNRRDYEGSTKYSDSELDELNRGDKVFMEKRGLEVANFLNWFAKTHNIPPASQDRKRGGLALMGWSMGNATALSLLGHPDVITSESYANLKPYLRKMILYDPPFLAFGYPQPPGYNPFADPTFPDRTAVIKHFGFWVHGYYNHPDLASRDIAKLDFRKTGDTWAEDPTTPEELASLLEPEVGLRSEWPTWHEMQPAILEQTKSALFNEKWAHEVLEDLDIVILWCEQTVWYCVAGTFLTEQYARDGRGRAIRLEQIDGASHFVHWDMPSLFWSKVVAALAE